MTKSEGHPVALAFGAMGYQTFVLRYSVNGSDTAAQAGEDGELPEKPEARYPAQMREIAMAMVLIREHAQEWHVDVEKVAICGFSAGAHDCSMHFG